MDGKISSCLLILLVSAGLVYGCFVPQIYPTVQDRKISLNQKDLETHGLAFITPSTVTGQEEEKQTIALTFAEVLVKERPSIRCVALPETINAINRAGLAEDYKSMFEDYRDTGIFNHDILRKVGEATKTKYIAQLKLANFSQASSGRLNLLGFRLVETKNAHIRLFLQIWDTQDGCIVWEGVYEMHYADDKVTEKTITLKVVMERAAHDLIARLP
jgi:DUF971 family protein